MALPPKEAFDPKNNPMKSTRRMATQGKKIVIWGLAGLFILEFISMFLINKPNYALFYYPILTNLGIIVLLLNFIAVAERLNFCVFKRFAILSMVFYYWIGVLFILKSDDTFLIYAQYFLIAMAIILFVKSIWK